MNFTLMAMSVIALLLIITPVILSVRLNRMDDRVKALESFINKQNKAAKNKEAE